MANQILTGAQKRAAKKQMDPNAFTRIEAQRVIATSDDIEVISIFTKHRNSHVKKYAEFKVAQIQRGQEELRAKRVAAAKKGAETRKKKASEQKAA